MKAKILLGFFAMFLALNSVFGQNGYYDCEGNLYTVKPGDAEPLLQVSNNSNRITLSGEVCGTLVINGSNSIVYNGVTILPDLSQPSLSLDFIGDVTVSSGSTMTIENWNPRLSSGALTGSINVLGTLNVTGCKLDGYYATGQNFGTIQSGDAGNQGTIVMSNTDLRRGGRSSTAVLDVENGSLSMTNCTIDSLASGANGIYTANLATNSVTINGGSISGAANNFRAVYAMAGTINIDGATLVASAGFPLTISGADANVSLQNSVLTTNHATNSAITFEQSGNLQYMTGNTLQDNAGKVNVTFTTVSNTCTLPKIPAPYNFTSAVNIIAGGNLNADAGSTLNFANTVTVRGAFNANGTSLERVAVNKTNAGNIFEVNDGGTLNLTYSDVNALSGIRTNTGTTNLSHSTLKTTSGNGLIIGSEDAKFFLTASSVTASDKDIQYLAGGYINFDSASSLTGSNTTYTFEFSSLNSEMNLVLLPKTVVVPNNFTVAATGVWNIAPGNNFSTGLIKIGGTMNAPSTPGSQTTFISTAGMFDVLAGGTLNASNLLVNAAGSAFTMDGGAATVDNCIFNLSSGDGIVFNGASSLTVSNTSFSLAAANYPFTYAAGGGSLYWGDGNSISGGKNYARISISSLSGYMYLPKIILPYVFTSGSDFTVTATGKLEIASGNTIKFANWFRVQGELKAEANNGESILFTSANDDNAGGNTTGAASVVPAAGSWGGILFDGTTSNASSLKGCELRFGGKGNRGVVVVDNQASPAIDSCNLNNSYYGFELQHGATPVLTANNIASSQVVPMAMTLDCNPAMLNNKFSTSHNQYDAIGIISGTLTFDAHIIKRDFTDIPNVTYVLLGTMENPAGKTLTIDPGIVIKSKASNDYIRNLGTLKALGTDSENIIFTSVNDDSYGNPADTKSDGNTGVPAAGDWSGIYFGDTSTSASILDHCVVKYATQRNLGGSYNGGAISMQNASPTISNTDIALTTYGIAAIQASNPVIQNVTIENTSSTPVAVSMTANPAFTNLTCNNPAYQAIGIFSETLSVSGNLSQKTLAGYDNITYVQLGDITIPSGINVTVDAGVVIKPVNNAKTYVDGGLKIAGTAEAPVVFTSINDDSYGNPGDTRMDGNSVTAKTGDWGAIVYRSTSDNAFDVIDNALLLWGGNYGYFQGTNYFATLHCQNASPTVKNTTISGVSWQGNPGAALAAGILAIGSAAPVLTENVVIENVNDYPIAMSLTANPQMNISSPVFNTVRKGIDLIANPVSTAITLDKRSVSGFENIPYVIYNAPITVDAGGILTIKPGVIIKFVSNYPSDMIVNGALIAEGTATEPVVFTSIYDDSQGGDTDGSTTAPSSANNGWYSITFNSSATQNQNSLKYCMFSYGSHSNTNDMSGMLRINNSYANIENCRFENASFEAIDIIGSSNPVIKDCSFTNINYAPIRLSMFSNPVFSGNNTLNNVAILALGVRNETWGTDGVCPKRNFAGYDNISYSLNSDYNGAQITINPGTHITIPAGMVFKQISPSGGVAAFNNNGNLTIAGTAAEPVVFTNWDDDSYGNPLDTRSNGNTKPNGGGVYVAFNAASDDASSIDHAIFAYMSEAVYLTSSSPAITNTRFDNGTFGVYLTGSSHPTIDNCVFNNLQYTPTLQSLMSSVVTSDNASSAGNVISGTTYPAWGVIAEELTQDYTLSKKAFAGLASLPYYFTVYNGNSSLGTTNTGYRIGTSATLTIEPGVICKFQQDSYSTFLDVKRGLKVLGTPTEKVIFTSIKDDFYGGDTNRDGNASTPENSYNDWNGITFESTAIKDSCLIDNAVIHCVAGAAVTANIAHPTITNTAIYDCGNGVVINGASNPVINNCDIYNITNYAVNNVGQVYTIDATNNWWGDNSGPMHSGNPDGTGTKVSDMVNYNPFITLGTANPVMGDVSLNGIVQAYDASLVLQYTVGNITLTSRQLAVADVSGDGTVGALDASLILMYVAGSNSSFPSLRDAILPEDKLALEAGEITSDGNLISVPINLVNAYNIHSAEWTAAYDARVLRPVSVEGCSSAMSDYRIDEANGEIRFAMAMPNAVSGDVNMATVVFEVLSNDATTLITSNALNIDETDLTDAAPAIEILISKAITGINNEAVNRDLEVTQTGSTLEIRFANDNSENLQVTLYDINGRLLVNRATRAGNITIEAPNQSGVYIVRLTGNDVNMSKKIIIK